MNIITSPVEGKRQAIGAYTALLGVEWEVPVLTVLERFLWGPIRAQILHGNGFNMKPAVPVRDSWWPDGDNRSAPNSLVMHPSPLHSVDSGNRSFWGSESLGNFSKHDSAAITMPEAFNIQSNYSGTSTVRQTPAHGNRMHHMRKGLGEAFRNISKAGSFVTGVASDMASGLSGIVPV